MCVNQVLPTQSLLIMWLLLLQRGRSSILLQTRGLDRIPWGHPIYPSLTSIHNLGPSFVITHICSKYPINDFAPNIPLLSRIPKTPKKKIWPLVTSALQKFWHCVFKLTLQLTQMHMDTVPIKTAAFTCYAGTKIFYKVLGWLDSTPNCSVCQNFPEQVSRISPTLACITVNPAMALLGYEIGQI